jgi:hypothetical protein
VANDIEQTRQRLLAEGDTAGLRALEDAPQLWSAARIPLRRVVVVIAAWSAPAYQLPDGRIIYAPNTGTIRADTLERIQEDYPHALIRPVGPQDSPQ